MRIGFGKNERLCPIRSRRLRRLLTRGLSEGNRAIKLQIPASPRAAENDSRVLRSAGSHTALTACADRFPVARRDRCELAPRAHGDRAAVLLRAGDPVWKSIVGGEMIDLCRWLV